MIVKSYLKTNQNGRIYQENVLQDAFKKHNERKNTLCVDYGELDHNTNDLDILGKNVSHCVKQIYKRIPRKLKKKLKKENKYVPRSFYMKLQILNTSPGKELKEILNSGISFNDAFDITPRCVGKLNSDGTITVTNILSYDITSKNK